MEARAVAIGLVLARSGSKRFRNKNVAELGGKPLLEWAIDALRDSEVIETIYVSTDSEEYGQIASLAGAQVIWRPKELATDDATSEASVAHALDVIEADTNDIAVLSQCTSPLNRPETIREAVRKVKENGYDTAISVVKAKHRPWWSFKREDSGRIEAFMTLPTESPYIGETPPDLYYPTGGVYAFKVDYFRQRNAVYGGLSYGVQVSQFEAIDIDTEFDLGYAQYALTILKNEAARRQEVALPYSC